MMPGGEGLPPGISAYGGNQFVVLSENLLPRVIVLHIPLTVTAQYLLEPVIAQEQVQAGFELRVIMIVQGCVAAQAMTPQHRACTIAQHWCTQSQALQESNGKTFITGGQKQEFGSCNGIKLVLIGHKSQRHNIGTVRK